MLTPEEAVEVINTFKGGTLCSLLHNWGTMGTGWNPGLYLERTGRGLEERNAEIISFLVYCCWVFFFFLSSNMKILPLVLHLYFFVKLKRKIPDNEQKERELISYGVKFKYTLKLNSGSKLHPEARSFLRLLGNSFIQWTSREHLPSAVKGSKKKSATSERNKEIEAVSFKELLCTLQSSHTPSFLPKSVV